MSKDLLLEIGTEEIPARFIPDALEQLSDRINKWLNEAHIPFEEIVRYATPRRLTVIVKKVAEKQEDRTEEVKGPSIKIAKDQEGNWSKAAQGFVKGQGLTVDDLQIKEINQVEYVFVKKEYKGQLVEELLSSEIKNIIESMSFPKNMRWGSQELKFVRPIRWLVLMFGDKVVPMEIADVYSDSITKGHRFLGKEISIDSVDKYYNQLEEQFVIVDHIKRKNIILDQIKQLEQENGWSIPIDEDLLEEVTYLVEYPTVLFGRFQAEFLEIPHEVLITSMREHQRYFPVKDIEGKLLPYFVTVRNGDRRSIELVAKGNEKVLTARLADAKFFYDEDQRLTISEANSKLQNVVFQEGLGTLGDKVRRIKEIAEELVNSLQIDQTTAKDVLRTADICKFDQVTQMVYEFPELQGLMGEKYAVIHGEKQAVAKGIYEHYLPRYAGDELPESIVGQVVSISDKLDNIVGAFTLGKIPTGSQDPLGLRRQAAGIVQILLEKLPFIKLSEIFDITITAFERKGLLKRSKEDILVDLYDFFTLRIKNLLNENQIRYDVIDAVLEIEKDDIKIIMNKALTLMNEMDNPEFKLIVDSFTRVLNIASKATKSTTDSAQYTEEEEHQLYQQYKATKQMIDDNKTIEISSLKTLKDPIDAYFDKVMVMVDDENLRQQRLGLLLLIAQLIEQYADFNKLVFA